MWLKDRMASDARTKIVDTSVKSQVTNDSRQELITHVLLVRG